VEEFFKLKVGDLYLYGVKHIAKPKSPVVLFLHGFTGHHIEANRLYTDLARLLCSNGISVVRFDYRHHGDSEGEFEDFTLDSAFEDSIKVYDEIVKSSEFDTDNIGLVGLSLGAGVAQYLASKREVKAIVFLSPVSDPCLKSLMDNRKENTSEDLIIWGAFAIKKKFYKSVLRHDLSIYASKICVPSLIIHCMDDEVLPVSFAKNLASQLKGKVELLLLERGGHVFSDYYVKKKVMNVVLEWFKSYLFSR